MNWQQALEAMKAGHQVNRRSEMYSRPSPAFAGKDGPPVFECGEEPMRLATAFSADGTFVQVFQGAESRCLFEPSDVHMAATDWEVLR